MAKTQPKPSYAVWQYQQKNGGPLAGVPWSKVSGKGTTPTQDVTTAAKDGKVARTPGKYSAKVASKSMAAADKNGVGTGSVVANLTNGHVKTNTKTGQTNTTMTAEQVKQMQRFLHNQGFHIGQVDGRPGPLTTTAAEAWRNSAPGSRKAAVDKWNAAHTMGSPTNYNPKTGNPNVGPPNTPGNLPKSNGLNNPSDPTAAMLQSLIQSMTREVAGQDPRQLGADATNAQFDPQINEALRELNLDRTQKTSDTNQIQTWFDNLISQNRTDDQSETANLKSTLNESDPILTNILGSLTDQSAKEQVGKSVLNNQNLLKSIGLSNQNYNSNMNTALAMTGRDQQNLQGSKDQSNIDTAQATLLGLIGQKADALTTNTNSYAQQGLQNQTNLFNLLTQYALLPAQAQSTSLKNQYTAAQIFKALNPTAKAPKYNTNTLLQQVSGLLNVGADRKLPQGKSLQQAAQTIGSVLQGVPNLTPGSATYRNLGYQLLGSMLNQNGQPLQAPAGWFTGK